MKQVIKCRQLSCLIVQNRIRKHRHGLSQIFNNLVGADNSVLLPDLLCSLRRCHHSYDSRMRLDIYKTSLMSIWTYNHLTSFFSGSKKSKSAAPGLAQKIKSLFQIVSTLLTIVSLLNDYKKNVFTSGVLLKPMSQLFLILGNHFQQQQTWKMRAIKAIAFLQDFKAKQKSLFRL